MDQAQRSSAVGVADCFCSRTAAWEHTRSIRSDRIGRTQKKVVANIPNRRRTTATANSAGLEERRQAAQRGQPIARRIASSQSRTEPSRAQRSHSHVRGGTNAVHCIGLHCIAVSCECVVACCVCPVRGRVIVARRAQAGRFLCLDGGRSHRRDRVSRRGSWPNCHNHTDTDSIPFDWVQCHQPHQPHFPPLHQIDRQRRTAPRLASAHCAMIQTGIWRAHASTPSRARSHPHPHCHPTLAPTAAAAAAAGAPPPPSPPSLPTPHTATVTSAAAAAAARARAASAAASVPVSVPVPGPIARRPSASDSANGIGAGRLQPQLPSAAAAGPASGSSASARSASRSGSASGSASAASPQSGHVRGTPSPREFLARIAAVGPDHPIHAERREREEWEQQWHRRAQAAGISLHEMLPDFICLANEVMGTGPPLDEVRPLSSLPFPTAREASGVTRRHVLELTPDLQRIVQLSDTQPELLMAHLIQQARDAGVHGPQRVQHIWNRMRRSVRDLEQMEQKQLPEVQRIQAAMRNGATLTQALAADRPCERDSDRDRARVSGAPAAAAATAATATRPTPQHAQPPPSQLQQQQQRHKMSRKRARTPNPAAPGSDAPAADASFCATLSAAANDSAGQRPMVLPPPPARSACASESVSGAHSASSASAASRRSAAVRAEFEAAQARTAQLAAQLAAAEAEAAREGAVERAGQPQPQQKGSYAAAVQSPFHAGPRPRP